MKTTSISDSNFLYYFALFTKIIYYYIIYRKYNNSKKENRTIAKQIEMCLVTKVAKAFVLVTDTNKQQTRHIYYKKQYEKITK